MTKQPFLDTPFLDTQGIAAYLGVNEKQIYTLIHERGLPATKITGKWLFPVPLVDRWIEASVINMPEQLPFLQDARELLLIAGSDDPLFLKVIGLFRRRYPGILTLQSRTGSSDGLLAMGKGLVHLACVHIMDPEGGYSPSYITGKAGEAAVVAFAERNQGLLLARGNPDGITTLADTADKGFRWAVRDVGTGTRALLERELDLAGIEAAAVLEDSVLCDSHMDVALAVLSGKAQVGLAIQAVAEMVGLAFLPLRKERFDLVIRKEVFFLDQVQTFINMLGDSAFLQAAASFGGYDTTVSGRMVGTS